MGSHHRPLVPRFILDKFALGQRNGRFPAALLFADISSFTPLTETLFQHRRRGAEILSNLLEETFGEMVREVHQRQGIIPAFEGDGFFAIFPETAARNAAIRAWETAVLMQRTFQSARGSTGLFATPYGIFEISMKVGLAQGDVQWGIIGTAQEATFYFSGEVFDRCGQAEKLAQPGAIVVDETILPNLPHTSQYNPIPHTTCYHITHRPSPGTPPSTSPFTPPNRTELTPFITQAVLDLSITAEFRYVCPVFISFQAEHDDWQTFTEQVLTLTYQYGGTFNRLGFGDKGGMIVLWFGAPVGHENSVARAAACLVALRGKTAVPWRAGLTYGLVWAGFRGGAQRSEYGCLGDVVNTAARIMTRAQWGEIWLDDAAAVEIQARYQLDDLGEFQFRGKEHVPHVYRLTEPRFVLNTLYRGEMVGRQTELAQLQETIAPIFNGRSAPPILIFGEAGIGKSRLASAWQEQLGQRVNWLTCPADDILRLSLNPFRVLLKNWFRQSAEQSPEQNQQQFEARFEHLLARMAANDEKTTAVHDELQRTRTLLASLINLSLPDPMWAQLDPKLRFENTLLALTAFLRALAWQQPIVLLLEDAHWLDVDSQQFINNLPRLLADYPVALILTSRYGEFGRLRPIVPNISPTPVIIDLNTFSDDDLQQLCQQIVHAPVAANVIQFLQAKSGGNPFFAEQLLLELQEQNSLIEDETAYLKLRADRQDILPTNLNALLIARLDRLPTAVKEVVQTAAILGQRFATPTLSAMLPADPQWANRVQEATNKRIWAMLDELHYLFKHALLREAAYQMQLKSRLRHLHHQAALILEQTTKQDVSPPFGEIAHHFEVAYELGLAEVQAKAADYLHKAGEQSAAAYENETAVTYFSRALSLTPTDDNSTRRSLLFGREAVYHRLGQRVAQAQDLAQLTRLTQSPHLLTEQIEVALRQARMGDETNDNEAARVAAETAVTLAQTIGDTGQEAAGHYWWGRVWWRHLDYDSATKHLQAALQLAKQANRRDIETQSLRSLAAITSISQWDFGRSNRYGQEAVAIAREIDDKEGEGLALNNLGMNAQFLGQYAEAIAYFERALTIAHQIGSRRSASIVLNNLGDILTIQGNFSAAKGFYEQALGITQETGNQVSEGYSWMGLGEVLAGLGEFEEAITAVQQAITLRQSQGNQTQKIQYQINLATIYLHLGDVPQALIHLTEPLTYLAGGGDFHRTMYGFRNHLRCYHILKAADDPRTPTLLEQTYNQLQVSSLRFRDEALRRSYLENIPWHREIMSLYRL